MKTVLVTGARGGIGGAIVQKLTEAGHRVVAVGREDADLSKFGDIQKLQERILSEVDHLDWIVCAHGYLDTGAVLEEQSPESIEATLKINTLSIVFLARQFLKSIPQGGGIIAISSSTGLSPSGYLAVYSASKAAVNNFMQAMARNRPGQKFFSVCPGATNTPMREHLAHDAARTQSPGVIAEVVADLVDGRGTYASGDLVLVKDGTVSTAGRL